MRTLLLLLILVLSVSVTLVSGNINQKLTLIQKGNASSFMTLKEFSVKPVFKGQGWYLATVSSEAIELIKRVGFQVKIVDNTP